MKLLYFYHIPKCSGQYLDRNISNSIIRYDKSICFNFFYHGIWLEPYNNILHLLDNISKLQYEYVYIYHHHHTYSLQKVLPLLEKLSSKVDLFAFTTVRDTVDHIVSHVNYMQPYLTWYDTYKTSDNLIDKSLFKWNFDEAINQPWCHNYQCKYLLYNHVANWNSKEPIIDRDIIYNMTKHINFYSCDNITLLKQDINTFLNKDISWTKNNINESVKQLNISNNQTDRWLEKNEHDIWLFNMINN